LQRAIDLDYGMRLRNCLRGSKRQKNTTLSYY
jgi:hypothetical protein